MKNLKSAHKPLVMLVLDGMGVGLRGNTNPISLAYTPSLNKLWRKGLSTRLIAAGEAIGLLPDQPSSTDNSFRVLSSGRKHDSLFNKVKTGMREGAAQESKLWKQLVSVLTDNADANVHLIGTATEASRENFTYLVEQFPSLGIKSSQVCVHLVVKSETSQKDITDFNNFLIRHKLRPIASFVGEKFVRTSSPVLVEVALASLSAGKHHRVQDFAKFSKRFLALDGLEPVVVAQNDDDDDFPPITSSDAVIFFDVDSGPYQAAMQKLSETIQPAALIQLGTSNTDFRSAIFHSYLPKEPLHSLLSAQGITQTRIAQANKFAEVAHSFRWDQPELLPGEKSIEVPEGNGMLLEQNHNTLFKYLEQELKAGTNFILANLSLLDSYAHAGDQEAIMQAASYLDERVGHLAEAVSLLGGTLIVTADHGNAELMYDELTGEVHTGHTLNPVPFVIHPSQGQELGLIKPGTLVDVAPTILFLLGLEAPLEMEGTSLLV